MGPRSWIRRHPIAASLIAFLLVIGFAAAGVALYVLSDQRRSAQLLSYSLREALGLEIGIERLVRAGPDRLVLKGVSFPGIPFELRVPEVRVEGPLLSLLTRRSGDLTLTAVRPSVILPPSSPGMAPFVAPPRVAPETLAALRETARRFLGEPIGLNVHVTDGVLRRGQESTSFSLEFTKGREAPKASLTVKFDGGASGVRPFQLRSSLTEADEALLMQIGVEGSPVFFLRSDLDPVRFTPGSRLSANITLRLPRVPAVEVTTQMSAETASIGVPPVARPLQMEFMATYLAQGDRLEVRRLVLDAGPETHLVIEGTVSGSPHQEITARFRQSRIDGAVVRALMPSSPVARGIVEIPELAFSARTGGGDPISLSQVRGRIRLATFSAAPTYPVSGAKVDVDLSLNRESRDSTMIARGAIRADSLTAGPFTVERAVVPYLLRMDKTGTLLSGESRRLSGRLWRAPVTATATFEGGTRKLSARFEGRGVDITRWAQSAGLKELPWNIRSPMRVASLSGNLEASLSPSGEGGVRDATLRIEGGPVEHRWSEMRPPFRIEQLSVRATIGAASEGRDALRSVTGAFSLAGVSGVAGIQGVLSQLSGRVSLRTSFESDPRSIEVSDGLVEVRDEDRRTLLRVTARPGVPPSPAFMTTALAVELPDLSLVRRHLSDFFQHLEGSANTSLRIWRSSAASPWRHEGQISLRLIRGEFMQGSLVVKNLRAEVPVKAEEGAQAGGEWGEMMAEGLSLYGLELRSVRSPVRVIAGFLNVSDLRYEVYGGKGSGWVEATLGRDAITLRTHFEGERVDLDRLVREYPIQGGMMTGRLRYTIGFRYSPAQGSEVGGTMAVKEPGGRVSITFLRRLLSYAESDPTGILRQTLENLSEFRYQTLDLDVRTVGGGTRLNLRLVGQGALFGLLPPKVREINIRNLPLDFLIKTLSQG